MANKDQIEIIHPDGRISFFDIDPNQGFTRIGRDPENDIVIDSPDVAPFHAMLDHRERPYQLMLLAGDVGQSGVQYNTRQLNGWEAFELNGHALMLIDNVAGPMAAAPAGVPVPGAPPISAAPPSATEAPAPKPVSTRRLERLTSPPPEHNDPAIVLSVDRRDFEMQVGYSENAVITVANGGDLVATFELHVVGLDPAWLTITPEQVNLNEGKNATMLVSISPPRLPSSTAGVHYFAFVVTSPEHPGRMSSINGRLVIAPFYEFNLGEVSPRQQDLNWFRKVGYIETTVVNTGNSDLTLRLEAGDDANGCTFEFIQDGSEVNLARQVEVSLASNKSRAFKIEVTPNRRPLVSPVPDRFMYSITATPANNATVPMSAVGQVVSKPLIGPFWLTVLALLLIVIAALIYRPTVGYFEVTNVLIESGESTVLQWRGSWFANVSIEPGIGRVDRVGQIEVSPLDNTTYVVKAENLLSRLSQRWFADSRDITVFVGEVFPEVALVPTKDTIIRGEPVTLTWNIALADVAILSIDGVLETIPEQQYIGNRVITPEQTVTVTITANNRYTTEGNPTVQTIQIRVIEPTPTPLPVPQIRVFSLSPSVVLAGESVTVSWEVLNVDAVSIEGVGVDLPPSGTLTQVFETSAPFVLTATNGEQSVRALAELTVNPQPTPTPVPGTPIISFFTASPVEVQLGSDEAQNVQIAWAVSGDFTDIELASPFFGRITGLPSQGSRSFALDDPAQFILTARNTVGDTTLTANAAVEVNVITPDPQLSGVEPSRTDALGSQSLVATVIGANFFPDSVVRVGGIDRPTTYISNTQLQVTFSSNDLRQVGELEIIVANSPGRGGGESGAFVFTVINPIPSIQSVSPTQITAGSPDLTLVVIGSGFSRNSVVRWGNVALETTYVNSTELRAVVEADALEQPKEVLITVFTGEPGGGQSISVFFPVNSPVPIIDVISPVSVNVDSPGFVLTVSGSNFVNASVVLWNGTPLASSSCTATSCTASISQALIDSSASLSAVNIRVQNPAPGPQASNSLTLQILKLVPQLTLLSSAPVAFSGQSITFTAQVAPPGGSTLSPTGSVVFRYNDDTAIATVDLVPGANPGDPSTAEMTLSGANAMLASDPIARKQIYFDYLGDNRFNSASLTPPLTITVNPATTATALNLSSGSSQYNQGATMTAVVSVTSPGGGFATSGQLRFCLDLGCGTVVAGPFNMAFAVNGSVTANLPTTPSTPLVPNNYTIYAVYAGDANFNASNASSAHNVVRANTTTTIGSISPSSGTLRMNGGNITVPVTVSSPYGTPPGTVTLNYSGPQIGSVGPIALSGAGTANIVIPNTGANYKSAGNYSISVTYTQTANFNGSSSSSVGYTVLRANPPLMVWDYGTTPTNFFFWLPLDPDPIWQVSLSVPAGLPNPTGTVRIEIYTRYATNICNLPSPTVFNWSSFRNAGIAGTTANAQFPLVNFLEGGIYVRANYQGDSNYDSTGFIPPTHAYGLGCVFVP